MVQRIMQHREAPIPLLGERCPAAGPEMTALFNRMVAKEPQQRPGSMAEVAQELLRIRGAIDESILPSAGTSSSDLSGSLRGITPPLAATPAVSTEPIDQSLQGTDPHRREEPAQESSSKLLPNLAASPPRIGRKLVIAAAAGFVMLLAGIIIYLKDKDGKVVGQVEVPDGTSATISRDGKDVVTVSSDKPTVKPPLPAVGASQAPAVTAPITGQPADAAAIDLLTLVDTDLAHGWTLKDGVLACSEDESLAIPYAPPAEYDLDLVVQRMAESGNLDVGLVGGGHQFAASLDVFIAGRNRQQPWSSLGQLDGKLSSENETTREGGLFTLGRQHQVHFSVRSSGVGVRVDGNSIIDYKGSFDRLKSRADADLPNDKCLFLSGFNSAFRISKLQLTPIKGQGRKLKLAVGTDRQTAQLLKKRGDEFTMLFNGKIVRFGPEDTLPTDRIFGIRSISLTHPATDGIIKSIAGLSRLQDLQIADTQFADEQAQQVANIESLKKLTVSSQRFTDAGLAQLKAMSLQLLNVRGTAVTAAGAENIRWALPDCIVLSDADSGLSHDRQAAEWVLSVGGYVWIKTVDADGVFQTLKVTGAASQLASTPFVLNGANLEAAGDKIVEIENLKHLPSLQAVLCASHKLAEEQFAVLADDINLKRIRIVNLNLKGSCLSYFVGLRTLEDLDLQYTKCSDEQIMKVAQFQALKSLIIPDSVRNIPNFDDFRNLTKLERIDTGPNLKFNDRMLAVLSELPQISEISANGAGVTDEGLQTLAKASSLRKLRLVNLKQITETGWATIARMKELRSLRISGGNLNDAELAGLVQLSELTNLQISGTQVTDAGLAPLRRLPALQDLRVDPLHLTETGLSNLAAMPQLQRLSMVGADVTNAAFEQDWLQRLPQVKNLYLCETKVSSECIERIKQEHPAIKVNANYKIW